MPLAINNAINGTNITIRNISSSDKKIVLPVVILFNTSNMNTVINIVNNTMLYILAPYSAIGTECSSTLSPVSIVL